MAQPIPTAPIRTARPIRKASRVIVDGRFVLAPAIIRRLVHQAMRSLRLSPASVLTVVAVRPATSRRLNQHYRQRPRATNVLTFVTDESTSGPRRVEADIILCPSVIAAETDGQRNAIRRRTAELIVHGVLHAAGRHHQTAALATQEQRLTDRIVAAVLPAD